MSPALLLALLACARAAELYIDDAEISALRSRGSRAIGTAEAPRGCMSAGRWHAEGAAVRRDACLVCACARGALSCRRRACAPLPEPPPRCHILHRKGECCPELHCPDKIVLLEHGASGRLDDADHSAVAAPASLRHACVEGGTVYSAGSALPGGAACEQCFCLGGVRRCVRPRCLPPPRACAPRPATGACCPQRYYCDRDPPPPGRSSPHDCEGPDGRRVAEGERVDGGSDCTQCFCLRGAVRCQQLACAPPLLGCTPLVQPGRCCPHQYTCEHTRNGSEHTDHLPTLWHNSLVSIKNEDRSFHSSKSTKRETTIKTTNTIVDQTTLTVPTVKDTVTVTKVKRKTDDLPPVSTKIETQETSTVTPTTSKMKDTTKQLYTTEVSTITPALEETSEKVTTTELPEVTVKIMINGTINCTTELSSTSLSLNVTNMNDTEKIKQESEPRVPYIDRSNLDTQTFSPVDIITDRNAGFDENETFTINVTTSMRTNSTRSTTTSTTTTVPNKVVPGTLIESLNISKKTKEDYDYDYTEPTLPPSLPNLKIIPFVAADAVVEDEISSKESLTYPAMERDDKFPVYYPSIESKDTAFPTRREDVYLPTQYPVFISKKVESPQYPFKTQEAEHGNIGYPGVTNDLSSPVHEYTVTASLGSHHSEPNRVETKTPTTSATFEIETPAVNRFSPPVETEGGFIPKGPGIIDEYYAVYPSTPSGPVVPHLTTSMQLDTDKGECLSSDGRRVPAGDSINLACSVCTCAWGELHCSPRPCHTPAGCRRRPATTNSVDLCCGELICDQENKTTSAPLITTQKFEITLNESKIPIKNFSQVQNTELVQENKTTASSYLPITSTTKPPNITASNYLNLSKIVSPTSLTPFKATEKVMTTAVTAAPIDKDSENYNHSLEYEEDDDDEGFSFGSVLKLLLSDNYEATTVASIRKKTTPITTTTTTVSKPKSTTSKTIGPSMMHPIPMMDSFVPVTNHYPYSPPKNFLQPNTINRIDHLVLGEATAIRSTVRPNTTTFKALSVPTTRKTTPIIRPPTPSPATSPEPTKIKDDHPVVNEVPRPAVNSLGVGAGLLKLAGCNIYGRMYRVGRIIAELSTPCQECRCTEIGVQCRPLKC